MDAIFLAVALHSRRSTEDDIRYSKSRVTKDSMTFQQNSLHSIPEELET